MFDGVSNDYLTAMVAPLQERNIRGTIGSTSFSAADIVAGSFTVSNQAMESTNVRYGSVYVGSLSVTMSPSFNLTRGTYRGQAITPEIGLKVNGAYEYVPVGVFTIVEAKYSGIGVELIAYDNMMFLDKAFPDDTDLGIGKPYDFLTAISTATGVPLRNTQAQIEALPNGLADFEIYKENSIETWRDLLSFVSEVLASFATIDREGYLVIRQIGNDTGLTLDATKRFVGAVISDYITKYTGVGCMITATNKYHYHAQTVDDGAVMNLGENPLLQFPTLSQIDDRLDEILEALEDFTFAPYTISMMGDIAFDLGDVITFTDGVAAQGGDPCCIMSFTYTYGRGYASEGYGDNPALVDGRSKTDKDLSGLRGQVTEQQKDIEELKQSAIRFLLPTSISENPIADGETNEVLQWIFENAEGAEMAVQATIAFEIETTATQDTLYGDAIVTVTYKLDGTELETYNETYGDGEHILTLSHIYTMEVSGIHTLTVELTMDGGDLA